MCKVDREDPVDCASPFKTGKLKLGKHTVTVTASDPVGNVESTPAKAKFKVVKPAG